jgi:Exportin-T
MGVCYSRSRLVDSNQRRRLITAAAYAFIEKTWPFLLKFLGDEYDDTSCAVLNFVNDTLSLVSTLFYLTFFKVYCA